MVVTEFQERVYHLLTLIPPGKITSYAHLSRALSTSPRAIGNALRNNPFAPEVPCHRVIAASGYIGGFMGEWKEAPSGINQSKKRELLRGEGVEFDEKGMLVTCGGKGGEGEGGVWFTGPWDSGKKIKKMRVVGGGGEDGKVNKRDIRVADGQVRMRTEKGTGSVVKDKKRQALKLKRRKVEQKV